jgi:hypothetical protein
MFPRNMQKIYKRWLILGLLLMCFYTFGFSDQAENVQAAFAPCVQECETSQGTCGDACATSCTKDNTREECDSCVLSCRNSFHSCMRIAVWCENEVSQPGRCTVNRGLHCILQPNGAYSCNQSDGAYEAYYLTCTNLNGANCVSCPGQRFCQGTDGTPACF